MKKQQGSDYSELLIWAAALVTVVRYAAAFIASDATEISGTLSEIITIAMGISGLGMGVLDVIGGAYLFTGWQKKMPANGAAWSFRFKVLSFFAIGLIVNGIFILIPFTMSRVEGVTIHHILGDGVLLFGWSAVVNIAPYLLIAGVAVGNNVVSIATNEQTNGSPNGSQSEQKNTNGERTYKSLSKSDKYHIANNNSKLVAADLGVTPRAIQKWRKRVQEEMAQGKL
jgi:hypothetical protein